MSYNFVELYSAILTALLAQAVAISRARADFKNVCAASSGVRVLPCHWESLRKLREVMQPLDPSEYGRNLRIDGLVQSQSLQKMQKAFKALRIFEDFGVVLTMNPAMVVEKLALMWDIIVIFRKTVGEQDAFVMRILEHTLCKQLRSNFEYRKPVSELSACLEFFQDLQKIHFTDKKVFDTFVYECVCFDEEFKENLHTALVKNRIDNWILADREHTLTEQDRYILRFLRQNCSPLDAKWFFNIWEGISDFMLTCVLDDEQQKALVRGLMKDGFCVSCDDLKLTYDVFQRTCENAELTVGDIVYDSHDYPDEFERLELDYEPRVCVVKKVNGITIVTTPWGKDYEL